ncbi:hypothetical protein D7D52_17030 [Nocardia yunnanensis]|uniref:XRE family transcriptional regulator n=2 Tax=Nocardia yunnanensis TaxID=2382165 RepID=A0A386ZDN0_9NOCA|nr:hypothetical protein D7D52_17030 [Nocardia yunnanensis]
MYLPLVPWVEVWMELEHSSRTRLEQLALQQGLGLSEFKREFDTQATAFGFANLVPLSTSAAQRWLRGVAVPRDSARRVLELWFGEHISVLTGPPLEKILTRTEQELAVNAAHESVSHAIAAAAALDPSALEHLHAAADKAARAYYTTPTMEMLTDLVALRNLIYVQMDRTRKPLQAADLYLLAGQACGLLSSVSWDLGLLGAADEQARAAYSYGCAIDHPSLKAWARALQVTASFWAGTPRQAHKIAAAALPDAPRGTARARLHSVNARALALVGAHDEVRDELDSASTELERAGADAFLDDIGGELAFDLPRRGLCAGAAYVVLGDGERAEQEAQAAVALFAEVPDSNRWGAGALSAQVDLGAARTLRGDLAGAADALADVFKVEPSKRTEAVAQRLNALAKTLGTARFRGAAEAIELGAKIEDFTTISLARTAAVRALPPA